MVLIVAPVAVCVTLFHAALPSDLASGATAAATSFGASAGASLGVTTSAPASVPRAGNPASVVLPLQVRMEAEATDALTTKARTSFFTRSGGHFTCGGFGVSVSFWMHEARSKKKKARSFSPSLSLLAQPAG
jgi:hypothetical protein